MIRAWRRWAYRRRMCGVSQYPWGDHNCLRTKHAGDPPHVCKCGARWEQ